MRDLIIFAGAPGSGKTTVGRVLQAKLRSPLIDLGYIRNLHLDRTWSNANEKEEQMAFENLIFIVQNYIKHGYKNIIVMDLLNDKIESLTKIFKDINFVVVSLILNDNAELEKRVVGDRDSGFKNVEQSLEWNERLKQIKFPNEHKIDNTHIDAETAVRKILEIIEK